MLHCVRDREKSMIEIEPIPVPIFYKICFVNFFFVASVFFTSCIVHQDYPSSKRTGLNNPSDLCLINIEGTSKKKCVENFDTDKWYLSSINTRLLWDSSGSRLALSINHEFGVVGENNGIIILNREGEIIADYREKERYFIYDSSVSWSPDGKSLLFSKQGLNPAFSFEEYESGIYIMKDDGTNINHIITCN